MAIVGCVGTREDETILLLDSGGSMDGAIKRGLSAFIARELLPWQIYSMTVQDWKANLTSGFFDDVVPAAFAGRIYDDGITWARSRGMAVASWGFGLSSDVDLGVVRIDSAAVARSAVMHLLDSGYQHAGIIQSRPLAVRAERQQAFIRTCAERGVHVHCYQDGDSSRNESDQSHAERGIANWIREQPGPLGLFAYQDREAIWLLNLCRRFRLSVPEQVGVIGVDDSPICESRTPALSSVRIPWAQIGSALGMQLLRLLQGRTSPIDDMVIEARSVHRRTSTTRGHECSPLVHAAMRLLIVDLQRQWSIADLASELGVAQRTLQRGFNDAHGLSPKQWLVRQRCDLAQRSLLESDAPIAVIAARCGFRSHAHFSKVFRTRTGESPSSYRRHHTGVSG